MKTPNYSFKSPLHLLQTTLIIDTTKVYVFDNHIKQLEKLWSKTHRNY